MRDEGDVSDELGSIFFHVQTSGEMGCFQRADYTLFPKPPNARGEEEKNMF
jgi:hypothetical protein